MTKVLIGIAETARIVGISRERLRYFADSGRLPAVRGRRGKRLFLAARVTRFARARRARLRRALARGGKRD